MTASSTPAPLRYVVWLLIGTAGLSACITIVFFGMRAVMDIGGACASGGPYVSANPCPEGVGLLMTFAFPAGFGFAALADGPAPESAGATWPCRSLRGPR